MPLQKLHIAPELMEQNFGVWEGQRYDEVWRKSEHAHDWSKPEVVRPEGGENFIDVCARVDGWLDATLIAQADKSIVIIAHAGSIRAGLRHARNLMPAEALAIEVNHLEIIEVHY